MHPGQGGEEFDPIIGCMWRLRNRLTDHQPQFVDTLLNWGIVEQQAETQGVREKIAHRDIALRRDGIIERSIDAAQYELTMKSCPLTKLSFPESIPGGEKEGI